MNPNTTLDDLRVRAERHAEELDVILGEIRALGEIDAWFSRDDLEEALKPQHAAAVELPVHALRA